MNPLADVLSEAWAMYKAHARHLLSIAFVVFLVIAVIQAALTGFLGGFGEVLARFVSIIAGFLLQAALVKAVEDVRDGRVDLSFGETIQAALPALGRVTITSILAGFAIGIGFVFLVVPGLYLLTIWCLIVPVIVLERVGMRAAFRRSHNLVRGYGWQVFGTLVLAFVEMLGVGLVISIFLVALPRAASDFISSIVSGTLVAPFLALVLTLGYFRLLAAQRGSSEEPAAPHPSG